MNDETRMQKSEFMSKQRTPRDNFTTVAKAAADSPLAKREAMINGAAPPEPRERRTGGEFVCITERHGKRLLRLARISQVIEDAGQIGGPWFVRCDGQQLPVSEANARLILGLLGLRMEG